MLKWKIRRLLLRLLASRYLRPDPDEVPLLLSTHDTLGEALSAAGKHSLHHGISVYVMGPRRAQGQFRCVSYAYNSVGARLLCSVTYAACWDD